jgi:hypothetical protein
MAACVCHCLAGRHYDSSMGQTLSTNDEESRSLGL